MKTHTILKSLTLASVLALLSANTWAADLTLRFTGKFVTSTCAFSIADVNLGTYAAAKFTGSYSSPPTTVAIKASNCTPDISIVHMKFLGTTDPKNSNLFKAVSTSGNVTGVGIQIQDGRAPPNVAIPNTAVIDWPISTVGLTFNVYAFFQQTASPVTPGVVKTPITVQFTYN